MLTLRCAELSRVGAICLAAFVAVACDDSEGGDDAQNMDASRPDSGQMDGGVHDGSVMDAKVDVTVDASQSDASTCYSPLQLPLTVAFASPPTGCECVHKTSTSYCINAQAVACNEGSKRWIFPADGYCAPTRQPDPVGSCQQLGGAQITRGATCPSGFARRKGYYRTSLEDAGVGEYDDCCYPIEVPEQNCTQAGLTVLPTGTQNSLLGTSCSNGGALRAFVVGQASASLCCAAP